MAVQLPRYRYRIDASDVIVWVDALWLAFAEENGATELIEASVLGRSLWDFVADDATCRLYTEIHSRVRLSGKPAILPFRCDSPSLQRHMRLTIMREDAGQLAYDSLLVRVKPQRDLGLLDSQRPRLDSFVTMCSCCKRALLESAGWLDVEEISVRLRLFEAQKVPEIRYTVCPACVQTSRNDTDNGNAA